MRFPSGGFVPRRATTKVGLIFETKNTMYSGPTVEIWKYDPLLFSEDGRSVDSLSLWLSLRGETDPRVRKEMDLMMEAFKW